MLSIDEIAAVPLFNYLPAAALERLARTSADLRLNPGEYAVHEGDPRALFIVIAGEIVATKLFGGSPRVIGKRLPGQLFGDVPLVFGTPFQGSFHAAIPSRVMRIEPLEYHAVAAISPEISATMGALARERMGGLQGLARDTARPQATLVGDKWESASLGLRRFLGGNQVVFDWLTPDDPALQRRWQGAPPPADGLPAVQFADGTTLLRPSAHELALRLDLRTRPSASQVDTLIVGGGPAGLAAAVYGASEGLATLVVEREAPGGQAETSSRIENYLGFPTGISGDDLAGRALSQAKRLGAEIVVTRRVVGLDPVRRVVTLEGGEAIAARTVVLATGVTWRRLDVPGLDRLVGRGVYYGAARSEASVAQGQDVHLVGAGNSAGQAALFFAGHARSVTLVVRGDALEKSMSQYLVDRIRIKNNIRVALTSEVRAVHGEDHLGAIELADTARGTTRRVESGALFILIGADAETAWLPREIARDARGYVLTGAEAERSGGWREIGRPPLLMETSAPGIFACGDVRCGSVKRVASGVGEGAMAIAYVHQFLALAAQGAG